MGITTVTVVYDRAAAPHSVVEAGDGWARVRVVLPPQPEMLAAALSRALALAEGGLGCGGRRSTATIRVAGPDAPQEADGQRALRVEVLRVWDMIGAARDHAPAEEDPAAEARVAQIYLAVKQHAAEHGSAPDFACRAAIRRVHNFIRATSPGTAIDEQTAEAVRSLLAADAAPPAPPAP
jgi:hypothetical protein